MKKESFSPGDKISIVYRMGKPQALALAKTLNQWLQSRGYHVYTAPEQKKITGTQLATFKIMSESALVIALGGDGTYLRAVRLLKGHPIPILGVNLGSMGFLTPISVEEAIKAVELTVQNKMTLEPRAILEVKCRPRGEGELRSHKGKKYPMGLALNDVVLERGGLSQLINIGIFHDQRLLSEVKSDGLIVSTPTGSTAYNLAAGGPLLHPRVKALVITPIAPHSLTSRSLIMPDDGRLSFRLMGYPQKAILVVDGQKIANLNVEEEVFIRRSKQDHLMVTDQKHDYFRLLREKLKFGDRT